MEMEISVLANLQVFGVPMFSGGMNEPSLAVIFSSHYERLRAIEDAARSGNRVLLDLALAEMDRHINSNWDGQIAALLKKRRSS